MHERKAHWSDRTLRSGSDPWNGLWKNMFQIMKIMGWRSEPNGGSLVITPVNQSATLVAGKLLTH